MERKNRSHSMRPDGKLIVDVKALLSSDRVQRDLETIREKIDEDEKRRESGTRRVSSGRLTMGGAA